MNYRILNTIDEEIEELKAKRVIAEEFVKQLETKIENLKMVWKKYKIVSIESSNIYFTNSNNSLYAKANVIVEFEKEYSHLQAVRMMELITGKVRYRGSFYFPGQSFDFEKDRYTQPSNKIEFSFDFSGTPVVEKHFKK